MNAYAITEKLQEAVRARDMDVAREIAEELFELADRGQVVEAWQLDYAYAVKEGFIAP